MNWFVVYVREYEIFEVEEFEQKQQAESLVEAILAEASVKGSGTRLIAVIHGTRAEYDVVEIASAVRIR